MQNRKQIAEKLFLGASSVAAVFVLTEIVMKFFGTSICVTDGCKMTAQAARFGDVSIFLIGFTTFCSIAALTVWNRNIRKPEIERLINLILIVALAGEGFFMGYLAFRIHAVCLFCVTVFGFMMTLGILRMLSGERDVLAGFAALAAVFIIQYLVLPAGIPVNLPAHERLILFYSKDCKHCAEIMQELAEKKIAVAHVSVNEYTGFLKNMGIEHVPTLMVNDQYQKMFLTGEDAIKRYLSSCTQTKKPLTATAQKIPIPKTDGPTVPDPGTSLGVFKEPNLLTSPGIPLSNNGMCKEDEICK